MEVTPKSFLEDGGVQSDKEMQGFLAAPTLSMLPSHSDSN